MLDTTNVALVRGACHCGNIQFQIETTHGAELVAWDCNCSICRMKRNVHTILPAQQFHLSPPLHEMTTCEAGIDQYQERVRPAL